MPRNTLVFLFAGILAVIGAGRTSAQQLPAPPAPRLPTGPEEKSVSRYPRFDISLNNSIVRKHESGTWSVLGVSVSNTQDTDQDGLIAAFDPANPSRQFARRVWVPAESRRYTFLPFQVPPNLGPDVKSQSMTTIGLNANDSDRETFQRRDGDPLVSDLSVSIAHDPVRSAMSFRRPKTVGSGNGPEPDIDAWETLMSARKVAELPDSVNDIPNDFLPPWAATIEGFGQFLLTTDRIACDAAGLVTLRSWVRDGGRLWIMLDRVRPETVRALLGNAVNFEVVDQVELDQYTLESIDASGQWTVRDSCDYETPVDFVRVMTSAHDIPCRVNGWPAAIWIPFGEGEVLVTTLAPGGWRPIGSNQPTQALRTVAQRMFAARIGKVDIKQFRPTLQQRIGYQIPGRSFGVVVLGGYCVSLLVGGVIFYRRQQAERLIWLIPTATLVAAGILAGAGAANSQSVPATVAFTQLVSVSPETDELFMHGVAASYDQKNRPVQWRGTERGWAIPDVTDGAEVRRQVWTNNDEMETRNASTRAGSVGFTRLDEVRSLSTHLAVRAWFGPEGLEGTFTSESEALSDPVIVAPSAPSLAVQIRPDGSFRSTPADVLAADQFNAESLLSDEQRRRQDVLRKLFNQADAFTYPRALSVAAWRRPFESSLQMPADFRMDGETLVILPLELERTPPGGEFRIPATFLRATSGQSLAYNSKTGQWMQGLVPPSDTNLDFQLPKQVLPCELLKGVLSVRLNAPSREFTVWTIQNERRELLQTVASPNGVYEFDLAPQHLSLDEAGRVQIGLTVGPTAEQLEAAKPKLLPPNSNPPSTRIHSSTWQIEYVRLTVDGRARPEDAKP